LDGDSAVGLLPRSGRSSEDSRAGGTHEEGGEDDAGRPQLMDLDPVELDLQDRDFRENLDNEQIQEDDVDMW